MYKLTYNQLFISALEAGLRLFGLPNERNNYDLVASEARINGIDLNNYKRVKGSGLIWGEFQVLPIFISERIKEDLNAALENFLYIGDFEYVFFPHDPDRKLVDYSGDRALFNEEIRDKDGKIYTAELEGSFINVITVDICLADAIGLFSQ